MHDTALQLEERSTRPIKCYHVVLFESASYDSSNIAIYRLLWVQLLPLWASEPGVNITPCGVKGYSINPVGSWSALMASQSSLVYNCDRLRGQGVSGGIPHHFWIPDDATGWFPTAH
jgi:hypothetical protein